MTSYTIQSEQITVLTTEVDTGDDGELPPTCDPWDIPCLICSPLGLTSDACAILILSLGLIVAGLVVMFTT